MWISTLDIHIMTHYKEDFSFAIQSTLYLHLRSRDRIHLKKDLRQRWKKKWLYVKKSLDIVKNNAYIPCVCVSKQERGKKVSRRRYEAIYTGPQQREKM
jgi:hypothetical protein